MLVILKVMWSSILTELLQASSKALRLLRAWGSKLGAAGGRLKLWDAWPAALGGAGGALKLWDAWSAVRGGELEL